MLFRDITHDTSTTYALNTGEQVVFFMLNRGGAITFELTGNGAHAHVFAFFIGNNHDAVDLNIIQNHRAPDTTSQVLVKSVLSDEARFSYRGTLHIAETAHLSDASQENRNLLLSPNAKAFSEPALEILTSDVSCHHAASTSPLSRETLFALEARGLSPIEAQNLLISGFLQSSIETLNTLVAREDQEKVISLMKNIIPA